MQPSLPKNPVIIETLRRLRAELGEDGFVVIDHWSSDPNAVGIASVVDRRVLAYVAADGEAYYVELELPPGPGDSFPYQVSATHSGIDFDRLTLLLREHFHLP